MTTLITIWWIILIVALIVTAIDVVLLIRVIRAARAIEFLTKRTLPAAQSIAANTALISKLEDTKAVAGEILSAAKPLVDVATSIEKHLDPVLKKLT